MALSQTLDTETTDLSYCKLELRGFSFCDGSRACYVNVWENSERDAILGVLKDCLENHLAFQKLIFHNAPFDLKVLHKVGCRDITPHIFCTMTASHLLNENSPVGLKYLARKHLNEINTKTYEQASRRGFDTPECLLSMLQMTQFGPGSCMRFLIKNCINKNLTVFFMT